MIFRSCFTEMPTPKEWGNKFIVPIAIEETSQVDGEGNEVPVFTADIINGVESLTVTGIVKAAVAAEFSQSDVDYVMLNVGKPKDAKVKAYTAFVAKITEAAEAAGYTD